MCLISFRILIDCSPSLSMLNLNALSAADNVIIPVQPQYLSAKGLVDLLNTIKQVRNKINPRLKTEGIVLTMVDNRTNLAKEIGSLVRNTYGKHINIPLWLLQNRLLQNFFETLSVCTENRSGACPCTRPAAVSSTTMSFPSLVS